MKMTLSSPVSRVKVGPFLCMTANGLLADVLAGNAVAAVLLMEEAGLRPHLLQTDALGGGSGVEDDKLLADMKQQSMMQAATGHPRTDVPLKPLSLSGVKPMMAKTQKTWLLRMQEAQMTWAGRIQILVSPVNQSVMRWLKEL